MKTPKCQAAMAAPKEVGVELFSVLGEKDI